ncbi:MAG: DUF4169 family protein [Bauldia sp.]
MAEVINLRKARKAKDRAGREQAAAEKRRLFGRTKAEKQAEADERERAERTLAGHRRDEKDEG